MRVILLGLPKTGINSMIAALRRIGLKRFKPDDTDYFRTGEIYMPDNTFIADIAQRDYWHLYRRYPNAKFILMVRDQEQWLASLKDHMRRKPPNTPSRQKRRISILGLTHFNETYHAELFRRHNEEVIKFFQRKGNLHVHYLGVHRYSDLCDFLEVPLINDEWPHENKAPETEKRP